MQMFKRIGLFLLTNILIMVTINIVLNLLGVNHYLDARGLNYSNLMVYCLVWGFVGSFISLLLSKFMAKMTYQIQPITANDARYGHLYRTVERFARLSNIKMPEVGVYESPEANAFATGATKNSSLVAVSTGLLQQMSQEEVDAVIGHEVAHVANGDMVTLTLIQGLVNAFVMFFAKIAAFAVDKMLAGNRDEDESHGHSWVFFVADIVFQILFGILGSMVVAYFSRWREFHADKGGARLAGKEQMIAALKRLQSMYPSLPDQDSTALSNFKISSKGGFLNLFRSHPPLEERIEALRKASI